MIGRSRRAPQPARQLEAVAAGKHHVEYGEVRSAGEDHVGVRVVGERGHGEPFVMQRPCHGVADGVLVLDHDDSYRGLCHRSQYQPLNLRLS